MSYSGSDVHVTGMSTVVSFHSTPVTLSVSDCPSESVGAAEPGVASAKLPDTEPLSGFPESWTASSDVPLSAVTAVRTVAVRLSGSPKSSIAVPVDTDLSVSSSGANAMISPFAPIGVPDCSAIAEIGNIVRTMHTDSQILKILFFIFISF